MNSDQKITILNNFINNLPKDDKIINTEDSQGLEIIQNLDQTSLPSLDIVADLMEHHQRIMNVVGETYSSVQGAVKQLKQLQNRKNNVNNLLDSMTAIRQAKRLSFSLGDSLSQIHKNLQLYAQIRNKIFYCDKYVLKIQEQIQETESRYKKNLQKQLKQSNSENIAEIAKILSLISQISSGEAQQESISVRLSKFYQYLISLEFKKYENQLFNIPIVGPANTNSIYIFFDIAKDVMKTIVGLINTYKASIVKTGGIESLHHVIINIFSYTIENIIMQILMRQKKYFEIEAISLKKIGKDGTRLMDYFNQFSAIQNQIQRLRIHLSEEISSDYKSYTSFNNQLTNCINTASLIELNTSAIKYLQAYTRSQYDKLIKKSPFIVPLWQFEGEFLQKAFDHYKKSDKGWVQSTQGNEYLVDSFTLFNKSLSKSLQTLNILIISSMVSFMNNSLVQQDSFHAFNGIFDKLILKFPTSQQKYYTTFILMSNYIFLMPNILQAEIDTIVIPEELSKYQKRLESQLKELVVACEHKCRQVITGFINALIRSEWFSNQLQQDHKKLLQKWKGFCTEVNNLFLEKVSQRYAKILFWIQFQQPLTTNKPSNSKFTPQYLINLEKQIRAIVAYYEKGGQSFMKNFEKLLKYIEILLAEEESDVDTLLNKFGIETKQEKDKIQKLRALRG